MKITVFGTGSWGFCLGYLLAKNSHTVTCWTNDETLAKDLTITRIHPRFPHHPAPESMRFTTDFAEAAKEAEMYLESVTTAGFRPVLSRLKKLECPLVITSKGIEQETATTLPSVALSLFHPQAKKWIGMISGPSFATEIIKGLPTSIVGTAFEAETMQLICDTFTMSNLRVYPNSDIEGIALAGALKNPIAIACGMAYGLKMGHSAQAALMTRGLHEIRKLAVAMGCRAETFSGLAGMGDLCMTCSSPLSRNFRFGQLIAEGLSKEEALAKIGMVVEGLPCTEAALQMGRKWQVPLPIIEGLYLLLEGQLQIDQAIPYLMQRAIKEEHL